MKVYNYDDVKYGLEIAKLRLAVMIKLHYTDTSILEQNKAVIWLKTILKHMDNILSDLTGIEYELYKNIVVRGNNVTKGVEYVAETCYREPTTIWKYYYPKLRHIFKK